MQGASCSIIGPSLVCMHTSHACSGTTSMHNAPYACIMHMHPQCTACTHNAYACSGITHMPTYHMCIHAGACSGIPYMHNAPHACIMHMHPQCTTCMHNAHACSGMTCMHKAPHGCTTHMHAERTAVENATHTLLFLFFFFSFLNPNTQEQVGKWATAHSTSSGVFAFVTDE